MVKNVILKNRNENQQTIENTRKNRRSVDASTVSFLVEHRGFEPLSKDVKPLKTLRFFRAVLFWCCFEKLCHGFYVLFLVVFCEMGIDFSHCIEV